MRLGPRSWTAESRALQQRAAREDLDVACLVGGLYREDLHDFAEMKDEVAR